MTQDRTVAALIARALAAMDTLTGDPTADATVEAHIEADLHAAACRGDLDAAYHLGVFLRELERDDDAQTWLRVAAAAGHSDAMTELGNLADFEGDAETAASWYERAAARGNSFAARNLAALLRLPRFTASGPAVDTATLDTAGEESGVPLPLPLRALLVVANGGIPDRSHWQSDGYEDLQVASFLRLHDSGGRGRTLEQTWAFGVSRGWLPADLVPFALDHGGNFFALDTDGVVVFYTLDDWNDDHTIRENQDVARNRLASSLWDFVTGLRVDVTDEA